jgi:hypothetical protein
MRQNTHYWVEMKAKPAYFVSKIGKNNILKRYRASCKTGTFWSVVPPAKPSLFDQSMRQNTHYWVEMKAKPVYFVSNRQKQHIE